MGKAPHRSLAIVFSHSRMGKASHATPATEVVLGRGSSITHTSLILPVQRLKFVVQPSLSRFSVAARRSAFKSSLRYTLRRLSHLGTLINVIAFVAIIHVNDIG